MSAQTFPISPQNPLQYSLPGERLGTFLAGLPKAELHCHIEGTLEPQMMFDLAARNGVSLPWSSVNDLRKSYQFSRLQDFLDLYYQGMEVLRSAQDFYDLTWAYLQKVQTQQVRHVELFFDPQGHVARGVSFAAVVSGITSALQDGRRELDISACLIMCFLRHLDQHAAFDTLEQARAHREQIIGVGLDSSELGHPPEKFTQVFAEARVQGYRCVAHAGEEGPPEYIWSALDALQVERVDHGNAALQDPRLVARLVADEIPLTVCPLSNLKLRVVANMRDHPLGEMLQRGLRATVNSDDPAYFGGYINENYRAVAAALNLDRAQLLALARNSITASFAEPPRQRQLLAEIDRYAARA